MFVLIFSRLGRPFLFFFLSNQHRCGHRVVRAPVVRGVAGNMEKFVLICPLGKSSGEISWILLQMFHCVCMLGIGVGSFDLNGNAPQRFKLKLCSESKSETVPTSGFSQVPLQSLPSVIRDMGIPRPVALIHLSLGTACIWHLQWKHFESMPAVADHQCLHASSHRVHFYINSALSSCLTTHRISFSMQNS